MDYDRDKRIDLNALHYEWMRQVELTKQYEEEVVRAKARMDEAEEAVKVEEAMAGKRAREYLSGIGKFTVDMVKDEVALDEELSDKKKAYIEAVRDHGLCKAAAKSIDAKKSALEGVVDLYKREYFAIPHEAGDYDNWAKKRFTSETADVLRAKANEKAKEANTARANQKPRSK